MSAPNQSLFDGLSWVTCDRALAGAFGLALLVGFIWPQSRLAIDLVIVTAIPGSLGAILWGLTFWSKARIQIGRQKLRYKTVRTIAGAIALFGLPFILMQRVSIYLRAPQEVAPEGSEAYPNANRWLIHEDAAFSHL